MAGQTITENVSIYQPLSFAKTRHGQLIGVNGLNRGFIWDGVEGVAAQELGIDAPATAPTVTATSGGGATAGTYLCAYRYVDEGPLRTTYSSLSPAAEVEAEEGDAFQWTTWDLPAQARVTRVEFFRALPGDTNIFYKIQGSSRTGTVMQSGKSNGNLVIYVGSGHGLQPGMTIELAGSEDYTGPMTVTAISGNYVTTNRPWVAPATFTTWTLDLPELDIGSDLDLQNAALTGGVAGEDFLIVANPDGSVNARRFTPPPTDRPYVFQYQDRTWYWGASHLTQGKVNVDFLLAKPAYGMNGADGQVYGVGVQFTEELVGRKILIEGDTRAREIVSVNEAYNYLTIDSNAATTAGLNLSYVIYPDPSRRKQLNYSEVDEPESVPAGNVVTVQENTGDDDRETGAMVRGGFAYLLMQRHKYRLSFVRQARIDANVTPVDDRGALNNACWDFYENAAFMLDENGPYLFDGGRSQPIDQAIRDLWRDGTVDLAKRETFHVSVDRLREIVRFFVAFTGDAGTGPRRALAYNMRRQTWDIYEYPVEIGASLRGTLNGTSRTLLCGQDDEIYLADEGLADEVGGVSQPIAWTWKSRRFALPVRETQADHELRIVFTPTTSNATVEAQVWYDHNAEPETFVPLNTGRWAHFSENDPTRIEFRLGREHFTEQENLGTAAVNLPGRLSAEGSGQRYVVFELSGQQTDERIVIEEIELVGVE